MWALIPLTVFGSLPRTGCICANGQHKFFCQRLGTASGNGRCACCDRAAAAARSAGQAESCAEPASDMPCCASPNGGCATEIPFVGADRPCRPVVDRAVFLSSAKSALDLDRVEWLPALATTASESPAGVAACVTANSLRRELLPPPDLVITLGVMLI